MSFGFVAGEVEHLQLEQSGGVRLELLTERVTHLRLAARLLCLSRSMWSITRPSSVGAGKKRAAIS
jgi:hypothetical protein